MGRVGKFIYIQSNQPHGKLSGHASVEKTGRWSTDLEEEKKNKKKNKLKQRFHKQVNHQYGIARVEGITEY